MDTQKLWQTVLDDLQLQVSTAVFQTLLSQTTLISLKNDMAVIGCKNPMLITLIEKKYSDIIRKTLGNYTQKDIVVTFSAKAASIGKSIDGPLFTMKLPQEIIPSRPNIRLNLNYTFENFAVSSSNQMAYAAATAVAQTPGASYNPLFLYGGVGVGKTHLMQAIGHQVTEKNPHLKLIYCTGEEFTNEIIEAIGNKTTTGFKKKYRQLNLFFIDDIQFIAGKYAIQEEFFHTFNAIQQNKGQIVMTSDRPPEEINKLETRLQSRFQGGLTIDVGPPDFELRTAILLIKSKQKNINLTMETAKLIAANIEDTRRLEGVLTRIHTEAQIRKIPIDSEMVKGILGKTVKEIPKKNSVTPSQVIDSVASYFNLKLSQLKGDKRDRMISVPRQILYYFLRIELNLPLMQVGELLGGRDHTTIMHGVKKINGLLSTDEKIKGDVMGIKNRLFG
ncbi:chromosomal replication initiator protein DnaA [Candidatus Microgenomates bacterium]|nr:chromosomal replication initiator protein DnaA [Candidatus Microgenomates bacterium]